MVAQTRRAVWERMQEYDREIRELRDVIESRKLVMKRMAFELANQILRPTTALEAADRAIGCLLRAWDHDSHGGEIEGAIKALAGMPGGSVKARDHLFTLADKYIQTALHEDLADEAFAHEEITTTVQDLDDVLLSCILSPNQTKLTGDCKACGDEDEWDPLDINDRVQAINKATGGQINCTLDLMPRSATLLQCCSKRRLASVVAIKAVGHALPPELVEMARYAIYSEDNIKDWLE